MNSSPQSSNASRISVATTAALACALVAACTDGARWTQQRRYAMGTWVDITHSTPEESTREHLEQELDDLLGRYEIDYYAWADGELGRLNQALSTRSSFTGSRELVDLLERARDYTVRSEGFFDPGVGALIEAWGFNSAANEPREPAAEVLEEWRRTHPSITDLQIDGLILSTNADGLLLDLGGIAKGEVIDRVLDRFLAAGVENVLVNAGGDVRVRGARGDRRWTIGIQSPRQDGLLGSVELNDGEAVFTSGDYERYFDSHDGRSHHLLDPVTGRPAAHTQAATVIARNGALADAAATAIFIAGPAHWRRVAAALGIELALRVDAGGNVEMTPAMRERVRMQADPEPATMIGGPRPATL